MNFSASKTPVSVDGLRVDRVVKDGDQISIGFEYFAVLETPGHTACSMTYVLEPAGIMFTSESTGVLKNPLCVETSALKSYQDTIVSAEKCKTYHAETDHMSSLWYFPRRLCRCILRYVRKVCKRRLHSFTCL